MHVRLRVLHLRSEHRRRESPVAPVARRASPASASAERRRIGRPRPRALPRRERIRDAVGRRDDAVHAEGARDRAPRWRRAEAGSRRRARSRPSARRSTRPRPRRRWPAPQGRACARRRSRISIATIPWPGAGTHTSSGMRGRDPCAHAEPAHARRRPARARRSSPASSLRSRVSTLPRIGGNRPRPDERRELRDAADAARADRRRVAEVRQRAGEILRPDAVAEHQRVARILARQRRGDRRARRAASPTCPSRCAPRGRSRRRAARPRSP